MANPFIRERLRPAPLGFAAAPSAMYGPSLCPRCLGVGKMRADVALGEPGFGALLPCDAPGCSRSSARVDVGALWRMAGFRQDAVNPPSLETFIPLDPAAAEMLRAARDFEAELSGWFVLHGGAWNKSFAGGRPGSGKSHLAEAIFRSCMARGIECMYVRATDLFEYLGAVWRMENDDTDWARRLLRVLRQRVLIIDEFGREPESDAVARLRFMVIEARWRAAVHGDGPAAESNGGATMLCSNLHPDAWGDQTVASRATERGFRVVETTEVDFRKVNR